MKRIIFMESKELVFGSVLCVIWLVITLYFVIAFC